MTTSFHRALDYQRAIRKNIHGLLGGLSPEALNLVPEGFNNNLIWNAGHVIATHELLAYGLSGARTPSGRDFIHRYRKGTRPEGAVGEEEITRIREELLAGPDRASRFYAGADGEFKDYATSFGIHLSSLEDAIAFNNLHECLHLGTMMALRRLVRQPQSAK
jgi:hypothetical protein